MVKFAFVGVIEDTVYALTKLKQVSLFGNGKTLRKTKAVIERISFATLDIHIIKNCFVVSESGGPLSCYDIITGQLKWSTRTNEDGHFLRLSFNEQLDVFLGISFSLKSGKRPKKIKYINKDNGIIENELSINFPVETEFALCAQTLVTSDRELINIKSGEKKTWS